MAAYDFGDPAAGDPVAGGAVAQLIPTAEHFIDKSTVLYGPSKTGKTVFTKMIMRQLQGRVGQILLVAPTEPSNQSYRGFIDPTLIHTRLYLPKDEPGRDTPEAAAIRFVEAIYTRQAMLAEIFAKVRHLPTLLRLYARLPRRARRKADKVFARLKRTSRQTCRDLRAQFRDDPGTCSAKMDKIKEQYEEMKVLVCLKYISPAVAALWKLDLSDDERYALQYLDLDPRLLLIFDDCAAELKPLFKKEVFRKLFYQGRHVKTTMILVCQDDTDLPTELRKNAFNSIYTTREICTGAFGRKSNNYSREIVRFVDEVAPEVYVGFRKFMYIREDRQKFYHITAPTVAPFMFGTPHLRRLCDAVRVQGGTLDTSNPWFSRFRVA